MIRRRIAIAAGALLALLAAASFALVWFLAYTERGLQFIVERVPQRVGRLGIALGEVSGTVAGGLRIGRIELDHEIVRIVARDVTARLEVAPLLWQTITVHDAHVPDLFIEARRRKTPIVKRTPRFLPPFLTVAIDESRVDAFTLIAINGRQLDFRRISAAGSVRHKTIRFYDGAFDLEAFSATAMGELRAADPLQLEGDARIVWRARNQPEWVATVETSGDLLKLDSTGQITAPLRADFKVQARELVRKLAWDGEATVHDFSLEPWTEDAGPLGRITGTLALRGDAKAFAARGPLTPEGLAVGVFDTSFEGSYANRVVTARRIGIVHRSSRAAFDGAGTVEAVPDGPRLALAGEWRDFLWPLANAEPAFRSAAGRFRIEGVWPYALSLEGRLAVPELAEMPFAAQGALARDRFTVASGSVEAFGGAAEFAGEAQWSPEERWQLAGQARDFDPATLRPDLPGTLGFSFDVRGEGFGEEGTLEAKLAEVRGRLRGSPTTGAGRIVRAEESWTFDGVRAQIGRTRLALDGRLAVTRDLRFTIDAEDLSLLAPESRGRLRALGTLAGTVERPILRLDASGSAIEHAGVALESARADIDLDGRGELPSKARVSARGLRFRDRTLDALDFTLDGTAASHSLALALEARAAAVQVRAAGEGSFDAGRWSARVAKLDVTGDRELALALEAPGRIAVSAEELALEPLCLLGRKARVCAEGRSVQGVWSTAVTASDLPLEAFTAGLTDAVTYDGVIGLRARLDGAPDRPWEGTLRAELTQAQLSHKLRSGRIDLVTLGSGAIDLRATPDVFAGTVELDARETGTIQGELSAARAAESWRAFPLRGSLRAQTGELGFMSLYFPEIDRTAGRLTADFVLGGTLGAPLVNGIFRLENAELDLYQVNLQLRGASLEARFIDNRLTLAGAARAGEGRLDVRGSLAWRDGAPFGEVSLNGEKLRLVDVPEAQIDASPGLDFRVRGRRIEVTGGVRIPYARIAPADLSDAVLASGDEVIVGAEPIDPQKRFQVASHVMMTLGEDVRVETSGLSGSLTGSIAVKTDTEEISRARGELKIEEGRYTAYGRKLDIQRGRLIFAGGLLGDPGVDIRAAKEFPDIVAGVNVRGTLLQPRLTFFSEPSIPQSQIVSLLIAGGSLETAQDSSERGSTRSALATQGGALLAAQLGERIGLGDVSIESTLDNDTALVLGRYLSPRLYVSYGISLTESINTFKARYTLGDRWTLKTEAGREQSAELVYTIEK